MQSYSEYRREREKKQRELEAKMRKEEESRQLTACVIITVISAIITFIILT